VQASRKLKSDAIRQTHNLFLKISHNLFVYLVPEFHSLSLNTLREKPRVVCVFHGPVEGLCQLFGDEVTESDSSTRMKEKDRNQDIFGNHNNRTW
jgi:hypothetical protein